MTEPLATASAVLKTPIGPLFVEAKAEGLTRILFPNRPHPTAKDPGYGDASAHLGRAVRALDGYFKGEPSSFRSLELAPEGTAFQRAVWAALSRIPYGETRSYGDIALEIGNPKAVRAVGLANGRNPLPLVVPCHRVIGANGKLTGFGGGLPTKQWLLTFERGEAPDLFTERALTP